MSESEKLSPKELTALLDFSPRKVFYGGMMVASGDTVAGPVVVIDGSLDVQDGGMVVGDTWVINGTLILNGTASVDGKVTLVNGTEYSSRSGRIEGSIRRYTCECRLKDEVFEREGKVEFVSKQDPRVV
ncbi:MAG: hypothetical protein NTW97_03800, partial [Candidatus Krumholzibacteria bacterium]|nr:hypothetical protein [Candidatus Krumholzibacteria bacterium]